jgi:hypothetical protein
MWTRVYIRCSGDGGHASHGSLSRIAPPVEGKVITHLAFDRNRRSVEPIWTESVASKGVRACRHQRGVASDRLAANYFPCLAHDDLVLVNSQFHAVRPSADLSSPLASVTKPLGMLSPVQIANLAIFDCHRL